MLGRSLYLGVLEILHHHTWVLRMPVSQDLAVCAKSQAPALPGVTHPPTFPEAQKELTGDKEKTNPTLEERYKGLGVEVASQFCGTVPPLSLA